MYIPNINKFARIKCIAPFLVIKVAVNNMEISSILESLKCLDQRIICCIRNMLKCRSEEGHYKRQHTGRCDFSNFVESGPEKNFFKLNIEGTKIKGQIVSIISELIESALGTLLEYCF